MVLKEIIPKLSIRTSGRDPRLRVNTVIQRFIFTVYTSKETQGVLSRKQCMSNMYEPVKYRLKRYRNH